MASFLDYSIPHGSPPPDYEPLLPSYESLQPSNDTRLEEVSPPPYMIISGLETPLDDHSWFNPGGGNEEDGNRWSRSCDITLFVFLLVVVFIYFCSRKPNGFDES